MARPPLRVFTIEIAERSRPLVVKFCSHPEWRHVLVEQMEGFNDFDIDEILKEIASGEGEPAAWAREILSLVGGCCVSFRNVHPPLPSTSRLYCDG